MSSRLRPQLFCAVGLLGGLICGGAGAEVYRWTDADGRVHFSDRPPEQSSTAAQKLELPRSSAPTDPELEAYRQRTRKLLEVWDEERRLDAEARSAELAEAERRAEQCERLRRKLARTRSARYVYRAGPEGEREIFSAEERTRYEAGLQDMLHRLCD